VEAVISVVLAEMETHLQQAPLKVMMAGQAHNEAENLEKKMAAVAEEQVPQE
jgi:hypothetical protein